MTPRSSCPGEDSRSPPGRRPPAFKSTLSEAFGNSRPPGAESGPTYRGPGSLLPSTPGSLSESAEGHPRLHHRVVRQPVPAGWFADELADMLHAEVQDPLHDLVRAGRCAVRMWPDASSTLPPIVGSLVISSAPGKPRNRFLWWPTLPLFRCLPMNSKPPSCFSTACSTNSSGVCSLGWSPSSWDTAAIVFWPNSSDSIRTLSLADASNCSIRM